jgi:hypothetical protein
MKVASLAEMLNDFKNGTYDLTDNGKCTECGNCCGVYLPLTDKEIARIRRYIKKNHIKECKHGEVIPLAQPIGFDLCCPSERPSVSIEYAMSTNVVNVRETFFGK